MLPVGLGVSGPTWPLASPFPRTQGFSILLGPRPTPSAPGWEDVFLAPRVPVFLLHAAHRPSLSLRCNLYLSRLTCLAPPPWRLHLGLLCSYSPLARREDANGKEGSPRMRTGKEVRRVNALRRPRLPRLPALARRARTPASAPVHLPIPAPGPLPAAAALYSARMAASLGG